MLNSLRNHWPEYLIEACALGVFMVWAGLITTLLYSPNSPIPQLLPNQVERRIIMGIAMGIAAIAIIYSPWGKRSGAHINPAVTITFFRLGKLYPWDAFFYALSQFIGAVGGVFIIAIALGKLFTNPPVNYIVTVPGSQGWGLAIAVEALMSFGLMLMVLFVSNSPKSQFTGIFSGILVAIYITLLAPFSGMSINPARSFGSAFSAQIWDFIWIYYFVPPLAMLAAAEVYLYVTQIPKKNICGKLCPNDQTPCLCTFCPCCEHQIDVN